MRAARAGRATRIDRPETSVGAGLVLRALLINPAMSSIRAPQLSSLVGSVVVALGLVALATAAQAAPPPAPAPTPASSRVLGLHVEGAKLSAKDRSDLFQVLQAKLRLYPSIELKNPPDSEITDEMIDLECIDLDADCLSLLGKKYAADKVVYVEVEAAGAAQTLRVKVVDVGSGKLVRDSAQKVAATAALGPAMEGEVEVVFGKPPEVVAAPAIITIEADQSSALIYLGAEVVGAGRVTLEKPAGSYTFRIVAMGYEEQILQVDVADGEAVMKPVALVKMEPPKKVKPPDDDDGPSWVVWAVIGAVVVGGAVTAIALSSGSDSPGARGPAILSVDGSAAWRDPATFGGRP